MKLFATEQNITRFRNRYTAQVLLARLRYNDNYLAVAIIVLIAIGVGVAWIFSLPFNTAAISAIVWAVLVIGALVLTEKYLFQDWDKARFSCPECRRFLPNYETWHCPNCEHDNDEPEQVEHYMYFVACKVCTEYPTALRCPYPDCREIIPFTGHANFERFAYFPAYEKRLEELVEPEQLSELSEKKSRNLTLAEQLLKKCKSVIELRRALDEAEQLLREAGFDERDEEWTSIRDVYENYHRKLK